MILRANIAYDGTDFFGFAIQSDGVRTVAAELTDIIEKVVHAPVNLRCAGRTDTGVHARCQVISFEVPHDVDPAEVRNAISGTLKPEIVCTNIAIAANNFNARYDATKRTYRYTIVNRPEPEPQLARYAWWVRSPLDMNPVREASEMFVGHHDFTTFCKSATPNAYNFRTIDDLHVDDAGEGVLYIWISAKSFLWQQVRSIVGTLVEVGRGKMESDRVLALLNATDRRQAPTIAPARGLTLWDVSYSPARSSRDSTSAGGSKSVSDVFDE